MHSNKTEASNEKKEVTSVSRSEEESVEELGEPVSKVLKETEADKLRFLTNPTLALSGLRPRGHPSSYIKIIIIIIKTTNGFSLKLINLQNKREEYDEYLLSHELGGV